MEKNEFRAYILIRHKIGLTPIEIFNELQLAYADNSPSYVTVTRWITRFKGGTEDLQDLERSGRPITAVTPSNIESVRCLIEGNVHISYKQIEAELSLSPPSINIIIHSHLKLRKIASRWVPYELTAAQKKKRVEFCKENLARFTSGAWRLCDIITGYESWIYYRAIGSKQSNMSWVAEGDSASTVVKRNRYEPKSMFTVFFRSTGVVFVDCLESGQTVSAIYYRDNVLKPVMEKVREQKVISGVKSMKILHDNARPHTAKLVKTYLQEEGIIAIDHPPYSPDLAPCDFWLFSKIKRELDSHPDVQSLKIQITEVLEKIPQEEYLKTFKKYLERMQLCITNRGDYFEHLIE